VVRAHLKTQQKIADVQIQKLEGTLLNGHFVPHKRTYKERVIAKINLTLNIILGSLVLLSVVSYYFITSGEMQLNQLRKETMMINDENIELQNHLDYLKSYSNVNDTMQSHKIVQKAGQVVEVSAAPDDEAHAQKSFLNINLHLPKHNKLKSDSSVNWSLGY